MKPTVVFLLCVIFFVSIGAAAKDVVKKQKTEIIIKGKRESPTGSYLPSLKSYLPPPPSKSYLPVSGSGGNNLGHQEIATYVIASGLDAHGGGGGLGYSGGSGRYSGSFGGVKGLIGGGGRGFGGRGGQGRLHTAIIPSQSHASLALGAARSFGGGHGGGFGSSLGGSHSSIGGLRGGYGGYGGHSGGVSLGASHSFGGGSLDFGGHSGGFGSGLLGSSIGGHSLESSVEDHSLGGGALSYGSGSGFSLGLGHSLEGSSSLGGASFGHSGGGSFGGSSLGSGHATSYSNILSGHSLGSSGISSIGGSFGKSIGGVSSFSIPSGSYGVPLAPPLTSYTPALSVGDSSHGIGSSGISGGYQTPIYAAGHKGLSHYSSDGTGVSSYNVIESKPVAVTDVSSGLHTSFTSSAGQSKAPFRPSVFLGATHESSGISQQYGANSQEYAIPIQSYSSSSSQGGSSQEYEVPSQDYAVPSGHGGSSGYQQVSSGGHGGLDSGSIVSGGGYHGPSNAYLPPASPGKGYLPPSTSYGIPTSGSGSYNSIDYSSSSASSHGHH